ncbi:MAG: cytochrome b5 domain-containing protein [Candidatus Zambryskibacteria bacterium]
MKKYSTISLFIFWAAVVGVIVAGLVSLNGNNRNPGQRAIIGTTADGVSSVGNITGVSPSVATLTLSTVELAKHNSSQSCWLLINGKIYDVTYYLNQHPGNAGTILPTCGTDATVAYDTKGRPNGSPHSSNAEALLANYFIGSLNQTLKLNTGNPSNTSSPSTKTVTNTTSANNTSQAKSNSVPSTEITSTQNTVQTTQTVAQDSTLALTPTELAKHNSSQSCWTLVSGKIYDLTNYINQHPGGSNTILSLCGADGTAAFIAQHGSSSAAQSALASLYIGDLNQTVVTTSTNSTTSATPTIVNPSVVNTNTNTSSVSRGGDNDEFEDD